MSVTNRFLTLTSERGVGEGRTERENNKKSFLRGTLLSEQYWWGSQETEPGLRLLHHCVF